MLQKYVERQLKPTWDWLMTVMDSTEAQLRFGASLTTASDPNHPNHPLHHSSSKIFMHITQIISRIV